MDELHTQMYRVHKKSRNRLSKLEKRGDEIKKNLLL
jgi:uncharacterized protein Yka (UPF0111/DUF47 family)